MSISEPKYIEGILKRFGMEHCKPVSTPLESGRKFQKLSDDENPYKVQAYQMLIGCLTYATTTRCPDLAAAVNTLSKYMSKPGKDHWEGLKRVLRYLSSEEDRKKGGGGILMYVVKDLCLKKVKPPKKYITIEVLAVQTKIEGENVLIVGMYRPPKISGSNYYEQLENELNELLTWASMQCSNIIIGGDLNLDKSKPGSREGKLNKPEYHKLSGLFDPGISDHCMIFSFMTKRTQTHKKKIITFRSKKNLNIEELLQDLDQAPWHVGEIFESVDDQYFYWQNLLNRIIDDRMPWKRMRVRERDVPYMTTEWKKAIRKKRKYAREFSKNRSDENLALKRKWRNEATRQRRKAIKEYWDKKALDLKSNPGAFFKVFKPFLSAKNVQGGSDVMSLETDGKLEENPQIVADTFVNYFNTMWDNGKEYEVEGVEEANVTKVAEQELDSNSSVINIKKNVNETRQVDYRPLIEKEVEEAMKDINPRKSAGWDKMAPGILKVGAKALAPSITRLYNECIRQMAWPSDWKKGQWTPAFKKDNRHIDKNYRPITTLPVVDKVFEKLIAGQTEEGIQAKLSDSLTAYRKGQSTETTLVNLVEKWKEAIDNNKIVGVLSTDMSKAFDSLYPPLLLKKLEKYRFSKEAIDMMKSYFENRRNRVKLGDIKSIWKKSERGCPQGSSLGPLLWNIYQNDLSYTVSNCGLSMYADDHQLYVAKDLPKEVEKVINENMEKVC
eukprot:gene18501-20356_t